MRPDLVDPSRSADAADLPEARETGALVWDAAAVRHLYNRAGFGARRAEIDEGLRLGADASVRRLIETRAPWQEFVPHVFRWEDYGVDHKRRPLPSSPYHQMSLGEARRFYGEARRLDREQFVAMSDRWFASMVAHEDPLRDRATLFWHGFFTTSYQVTERKAELMRQFQLLRRGALGTYAELLRAMVRDPGLLQYLDNVVNEKHHPNENFARELMELFSLGEGNYTETDVREAARALSGFASDPEGWFTFEPEAHDDGEKCVLGVRGRLGGDDLPPILLAQEACGRWVARRIIGYFEGVEPDARRSERYAERLRASGYDVADFFQQLFTDPAFYRPEVRGARVQGPIDFLVGACRKLSIEPPPAFLHQATLLLGQAFYAPPSVKGWSEGPAWIQNDMLILRSNCVALLLHAFAAREEPATAGETADEMSMADACAPEEEARLFARLRRMADASVWPDTAGLSSLLRDGGASSDAEVARWALSEWLSIEPPEELFALASEFVRDERLAAGVAEGSLSDGSTASERALRELALLVFSLPEAQVH
jgi:hypothetical protein